MNNEFKVYGISYKFNLDSVDGETVLVARLANGIETDAMWTSDAVSLPESDEEATAYLENMDWAVEESSKLDSNKC